MKNTNLISIEPGGIAGQISIPSSKSMMQRAVFAATLARGESQLLNPNLCEDAQAALGVAQSLGATWELQAGQIRINGGGNIRSRDLDCGESGLCLRMACAIAPLFEGEFRISGRGSLLSRPVDMVEPALRQLGCSVRSQSNLPPLFIRGPLRGGRVQVDGSLSSQFLSGLLMALPLCQKDSSIEVPDLVSKPYVRMTLSLLRDFGIHIEPTGDLSQFSIVGSQSYRASAYMVEGDWSAAAFWVVAGAIAGALSIQGLNAGDQADQAILQAAANAGVDVTLSPQSLAVQPGTLRSFQFDASQCPDLFPALVALACYCPGRTILRGAQRLIHKESNRAATLAQEFSKLGARIEVRMSEDVMEIQGGKLHGGTVDSHGDHRIAMALAVAALGAADKVDITGIAAVSKSYPAFFEHLASVRVSA